MLRITWVLSERGKTYISSGLLLPSKVTHLVIKRPLQFDFHPGDYVFVNIPAIANYEWHPFTISSAPEQEGRFRISKIYPIFHHKCLNLNMYFYHTLNFIQN